MDKIKEILVKKKKLLIMIAALLGVAAGIYSISQPEKVLLIANEEASKGLIVEYGNSIDTKVETYLNKDILENKEKKDFKLETDAKNEEGKEYPAVGKYTVTITYKDEKIEVPVEVKK